MNREIPDVQAGFRKGRGTRDQIANILWIIEKARGFQKNICFIDYTKVFDCVDHNKLWKILQEMGIPDHLTWLLRNLYAGQEATFRTGHGTGSKSGKYVEAVYCHPAYLTFMQSTSWETLDWMKHKLGIKIAGRNINNLRYTDDTTLMAERWRRTKEPLDESERGEWKKLD